LDGLDHVDLVALAAMRWTANSVFSSAAAAEQQVRCRLPQEPPPPRDIHFSSVFTSSATCITEPAQLVALPECQPRYLLYSRS
jgi:hypothetical protein